MLKFTLRKLRNSVLLLVLASMVCFALVVAAPGNIAQLIAEQRMPGAPQEMVDKIADELGLNDPIPQRYWHWLRGVGHGDFGTAYITGEDVGEAVARRLGTTAALILGGSIFTIIISAIMGTIGAWWPGRWPDHLVRAIALLGASTPQFFGGALLIFVFAVSLRWLPSFGAQSFAGWILPSLTIALLPAAVLSRIIRVGVAEAMTKPYALTARAKGLPMHSIVMRDAAPNVVPAYVSALGNMLGAMTVGAIVVEPLFALHGIGEFFVNGVRNRDFMVMQACLLLFIAFVTLVNLAVEFLMMAADPKLRSQTL